jgi:hypothetical protein
LRWCSSEERWRISMGPPTVSGWKRQGSLLEDLHK